MLGAFALLLVVSVLVEIPKQPDAHAALGGLTNFEIDANQAVNGPTPPSGGAGIDWANAASFLQDAAQPIEACINPDPSAVTGKLDEFDWFAPNPTPDNITIKNNICQAFVAWQPVNFTEGGVSSIHYVLYGGWRRNAVPGDMSFFVPLIGGQTKSTITLVHFNFDPNSGTSVELLSWNGSAWVPKVPAPPASAFQSQVELGNSPAFGEFAVDLTAAGVLPTSQTCTSVVSNYVVTRAGNGNADLEDFVGLPPLQISNCSAVRITKATTPAVLDTAATFTYNLNRVDGGPVQDNTPLVAPNLDSDPSLSVLTGSLTVPTSPTDNFSNIFAAGGYRLVENLPLPPPWSRQSVACNYFNPAVLDANLKATPATVVLTNPDGTPNANTFVVAPTGLLPAGVTVAADCTISNQAPSLTLAKRVVNTVGNAPATPNMWHLSATPTPPGAAIDYGPGTSTGMTKVVAPSTYTLAETPNTTPAPPAGYIASAWTCVDAAGNPVTVSGGNQVTLGATANVTCTISNTADDLARLTLQKTVVGGTATEGQFTLTAQQSANNPGSIDGSAISGIEGALAVTDRHVTRGTFSLSETGPPGYVESWLCTNGAGATVSTTNQVEIPTNFTDPNQLVITCTVTNTTTAIDVNVTGAATNPAGRPHTFTLTATRVAPPGPLTGALLDLTFSNPALVIANTCQTAPGTNASGQCTVTVNSTSPGPFTITVNGFTNQGPNGPLPGQPFTLPAPVSSNKLWTTYHVEGESAVNLVGDTPHVFTLSGFQNDGTGESALPAGSVISYTWSGAGTVSPAGQCTVNGSGTCDVTVSAAANEPETSTLTVTSITVSLPNGLGGSTSHTLSVGDQALSVPLPALTKSWIAFRVRVEPSEQVNLVGQPHTFTVTAEFAATPGVWQPVSGGSVVLEWTSAVADAGSPTTCPALSAAGTCTFTVVQGTPPEPGTGTLQVTGLTVTIGGQTTTLTDDLGSSTLDLSAATGQKSWVLIDVTITPGADNLAGEPHTFTVQVTGTDGDGPFVDGGVPGATVTSSVVSAVGGATVTGDTCTTPGTNATGQCTITVTAPASGSIELQLEQVTVTIDGQEFVIDLVPGARGVRADAVLPIRTDKVWWQYRVILSDDAINPLGVTHTFTATVQRTRDGGANWLPVPTGALLQHQWTDNPVGFSSVNTADSTCLTTGTALDGTCTFEVTATDATTGTLTIQGIASTWLDRNRNGQRGAPTDPIPNPTEFAQEIVTIPQSMFGLGSNLSASKTWWDFAVDVSGPAENPVGTDHTFTLTVQYTDGFGFQPVSPGTTMTYLWSGPAGSAEDTSRSTCDPADASGTGDPGPGQCTVVIESPTVPGTGTLTITGIASTSIPQPTPPPSTVSFTFPTAATPTKTWIAYRAIISASATNLAGSSHPFTITVQEDRGAGFVAVPDGTTLAVVLTDPAKLVSNTCATGTTGGTCTVTVSSTDPGSVTVTPGAITVSLLNGTLLPNGTGVRVPVTVAPGTAAYATPASATKTWVEFRLGVSPSATNLAGVSHTFIVTAEFAVAPDVFQPLTTGLVDFTRTGAGAVAAPTTCPTLGAAGTCTVTVNSADPGVGILTLNGLSSATVTVGGTPTTFTDVNPTTAPNAIGFTSQTATKTWIAYSVTITPTANNPVGTQHDFVITADVQGSGAPVPAVGASIAFTWTGAGTPTPSTSCTTNAAGTCTVSVTSPSAGTGTLTVTSLTDSAGRVVDLTVAGSPGQSLDQTVPLEASKTWLQYRVLLSPSATNLVGVPHTFTATVQQTGITTPTAADWVSVPDATTLTATPSGSGTLDPASTCLTVGTTGGTCQFAVHDAGPGTLTLNVTAIGATTVDGVPFTNIGLSAPASATKTWVSVLVSVTPSSATNLSGDPHTFTVHVDVAGADGTATPHPAEGATVAWTFPGPGTVSADTCATGTTAGTCVVTFDNSAAGSGTFTATSVTVTVSGTPLTVNLTAAAPGQAPGQVVPVTATKTWLSYLVTITPSANNPVSTTHDFVITATVTNGTTTSPAVNASIAFIWSGPGSPVTPSPCVTDANGTCTVSVTSSAAGTGTLQVLNLTDSGGATVDLTVAGMPGQAPGQTVPLTASKTWLQYRVLLSPNATNLTGVPHTFTATVQQTGVANPTEANWTAVPIGTTLTASTTGPGTLNPASSCLTPGTTTGGTCQFVVHDTGPGTLTLTVTAIGATTVDGLPFTNIALSAPAIATKTWLSVLVSVTPPSATNLAGDPHTFTVHVDVAGADGTATALPAEGATVAWTFPGPGTLSADTCATGTTAGTCVVTFTNSGAGAGTFTATSVTVTVNGTPLTVDLTTAGLPGQAPGQIVPVSAAKTWVAYTVTVSPSINNPMGTQHDFVITATATNGTTTTPAANASIEFVWSGAGSLVTPSPCITGANGTCTVSVTSPSAGSGTLTVTSLTDSGGATVDLTVAGMPGQAPGQAVPLTASKTWLQYRVLLSPSATNLVGVPHTFTATVQQTGLANPTGADWTAVPIGTTLTASTTGPGTLDLASTCLTPGTAIGGTCQFVVHDTGPGTLTLTVAAINATTVDGLPFTNIALSAPATATKTWLAYTVTLSPSATNPAGVPHAFTVTATVTDGTTPAPAVNASIAFTWLGAGSLVTPSPCTTNAAGTCTVSVTSPTTGSGTLTVTSLTDSGGRVVNLAVVGAPGQAPGQTVPLTATKTWSQYRVLLTPSATNLVGVPHTFTATVQHTEVPNPTEGDWVSVPDGTTLTASTTGPGTLDPVSSCVTPGTTGGTCQFVVHDAGPGTLTLTVTAINATTVDGLPVSDDIPLSAPATATKTWLAYTVTISPSATNPVGVPHNFVITAAVNSGTSTVPAAGASITFTWSGVGTPTPSSSCTTNAAGTCTVSVTSPSAGSGTLTVTSLTDSGGRVVNLAVVGAPGQAPGQTVPLTATKTWSQYRVLLSANATNLTGVPHTFTATVQHTEVPNPTEGDWVSVPDGTTLTASTTGPGTLDPVSSCVTPGTTGGTCQFVVHDAGPGTLTLTVTAINATTVDGLPVTDDIPLSAPATATKTWVAYTVTISPSINNPVGTQHDFTITATVTDGTTTSPAANASIAFTLSGTGSLVTPSPCTTSATGTCTVSVTSPTAGTGTLTVTSLTDSGNRVVNLTVPAAAGQTPGQVVPLTASKTWVQFRVLLSSNATNLVGVPHTFTAVVQTTGVANPIESDWGLASDGTTLAASTPGPGTIDPASTCLTTGTTLGLCQFIVHDAGPGTLALTVTAIASTSVNAVTFTDILLSAPATASKTWLAYTVTVSPSASNPVGVPHNFTVTATVNDGTSTTAAAGASIAFGWSGAGALVTQSPCTTGTAGTCTVTVTSPSAGSGTLTVTSLTDSAGRVVDLTAAGAPGQAPGQAVPLTASKTWSQYRVLLTPSATNLVGVAHTFTATVQHSEVINPTEGDWTEVPDGTTLAVTPSGSGTLDPASSCLTAGTSGGTCQLIVHDTGAGTLELTVTAIANTTVDGLPVNNIPLSAPATASKTWIAYLVTVSPSANNPVGTQHDFVITATVNDGASTTPAAGASIAFGWLGAGALVTPSPCTTDAPGTCTVSVTSPSAGTGTLTVTSLTDSAGRTVGLTVVGAPGQASGQVVPLTSSKTWLQFRVLLSPNATNLTGVPHTFTATVQQTGVASPAGTDWTAVPDGTRLTATPSGSGTLDPASTCLTVVGTSDGTCQFIVHDTGAGTLTLNVTAIGATTVDGVPFTNIPLSAPASASKTWVAALVSVTPSSATNLSGDPHTFTVHVDVAGADGTSAPLPADGATVAWTFSGSDTVSNDTCATGTTAGTCVVTFNNGGASAGTFSATSVTFTVNGQEFTVDLTTQGTPGQASGQVVPVTATKTWLAYTVTISPTATNPVGTQHDFAITATVTDGTTPAPAANASIAFTWSGAGSLVTPSPCTTTAAGTCTVSVTSPSAGSGTLTVTTLTDSGGRVVDLTVAGAPGQAPGQTMPLTASKTWLRYRVLLSANATNLTGVAHTFTATVQQTDMADADAEWTAVPDGTTLTATPSGSGFLDPASQCLTAGTNGGTCQFIVHDNGPGTLTLDVTAISTTVIDGVPFSDIPLSVPAIASKTWLAYTVTVSPSATNLAGTPHDFAITATMTDGETSTPATNASIAFTWSGTESSTPASACTTDSAGMCTVTVTSSTAGSGTLTVASLTDSAGRLVDLTTAGAPGQAQGQVVPLTATKTWVFANLVVHKTANGATPVAGGDPFNYTITVTNEGPLATSSPVTVTDTIGSGLEFAGTPSMPVSAGSCAPPSGSSMTCTITTLLAVGDTVTIVVPARVAAGTVGPVENVVTADSREDPLCPNGTCPPPPECAAPTTPATQTVAVLASTTAADPSDNQACVLSSVTAAGGTVVPPPVAHSPLARTGPDDLSALLGALLLLSGFGLVVVTRRRARSPA